MVNNKKKNSKNLFQTITINNIFNNNSIILNNSNSKLKFKTISLNKEDIKEILSPHLIEEFNLINEKEKLFNSYYNKKEIENDIIKNEKKKLDLNFKTIDIEKDFESDSENINLKYKSTKKTGNINIYFKKISKDINIKNNLNNQIEKFRSFYRNKKNKKSYFCKYCKKKFNSGCSLGGHISKNHKILI